MKKKPKRVVLGVGHPWFSSIHGLVAYDSVGLYPNDGAGDRISLNPKGVGGWNKVRLVLEIIK